MTVVTPLGRDFRTTMQRAPRIGERCAAAAGKARRNDLIREVHLEQRCLEAPSILGLETQPDFTVPREFRLEFDTRAIDADGVLDARRCKATVYARKQHRRFSELVGQPDARHELREGGRPGLVAESVAAGVADRLDAHSRSDRPALECHGGLDETGQCLHLTYVVFA